MTEHPLILVDRTRVVQDWTCPRARYYAFELGGRGISPRVTATALDFGIRVHEALASFIQFGDLTEAVIEATKGIENPELRALLEGLIYGWHKVVWPALMEEYEVVLVEAESVYDVPGSHVRLMAKPDLILRRKSDGTLWYLEWKSTSTLKAEWFQQWERAPQLWAGGRAVEQTYGLKISGAIVQALYKGYVRDGKQQSPFCWIYKKFAGVDLHGVEQWEYSVDYQRGREWSRVPTWLEDGGVKAVVDALPVEALKGQFPSTPPIFADDTLVANWLAQMAARERTIDEAVRRMGEHPDSVVLNAIFPQRFDRCVPVFGSPCEYKDCCFIDHVGRDPLASGLYTPREPHHETETFEEVA